MKIVIALQTATKILNERHCNIHGSFEFRPSIILLASPPKEYADARGDREHEGEDEVLLPSEFLDELVLVEQFVAHLDAFLLILSHESSSMPVT